MSRSVGIPLATVLQRRGALTPGEVVTLIVPLAQALADLHRRGVTHGAVSPSTVLIATDGRPVLTDAIDSSAAPQDDGRALVALAGAALGRGATGPVADALRSGAAGDDLATALLAACPPVPISVTGAIVTQQSGPTSSAVHRRRTAVVGTLAVASIAVVGAATAGHASSRPRAAARALPAVTGLPRPTSPAPAASPRPTRVALRAPARWRRVAVVLERRRAAAYARDDVQLLSTVYVRGSRALSADARQLRQQLGGDTRARGLTSTILRVHVVSVTSRHVELAVVDSWSAYDVVHAGQVLRHGRSSRPRRVLMSLRRTRAGWRIASVRH